MPYISREDREHIRFTAILGGDTVIEDLAESLRDVPSGKVGGALNYTICRLACLSMKPDEGWGYTSLAEMMAHVRKAEEELDERLLKPYERYARYKNGDVEELADIEREYDVLKKFKPIRDPQGHEYK